MSLMRSLFLVCSQSVWLRERATRYRFVRRAVKRFMPGETIDDALVSAGNLKQQSMGTVFTYLGENVSDPGEAKRVADHYLDVLDRVRALGLGTEVSVKLTQLGLDLGEDFCYDNLCGIIDVAVSRNVAVLLAGIQPPTNYGEDYRTTFNDIFMHLLSEYRGRMREEVQRLVGTTQEERDEAVRALREGWKEQTEALQRLRKDLERGQPGV